MCKVYLGRQLLINFAIILPITLTVCLSLESLLVNTFGLDEITAVMAARQVGYSIPGSWFLIHSLGLMKYLTMQRQMQVFLYTGFAATVVSVLLNYLLLFEVELGEYGLAITYNCQNFTRLITTYIWIWWTGFEDRLNG
jgi:Na+-driven multidrug efflux pump